MKRLLSIVGISFTVFSIGFPAGKHQSFPYKQTSQLHGSLLRDDSFPPEREIRRTDVLNTLIEKYGYRSYLEIGQGQRTDNIDLIDCPIKIGVDPEKSLNAAYQMTSDEFFAINNDSFDLIFIDGLHMSGQVEKDINNSLKILKENGTIVVHDCNPANEEMQMVPRIQQIAWTGDVWKAWVKFRATRPDLKMYVIDADFGIGIIRKGSQETISLPDNPTYEYLDKNRRKILNLIDIKAFLDDLKNRPPRP
jgi:hypothetical protein